MTRTNRIKIEGNNRWIAVIRKAGIQQDNSRCLQDEGSTVKLSSHKRKLLLPMLVIAIVATVTIYTFSSITAKPTIAFSRDKAVDLALTSANNDPARNATALPNVKVNALLLRIDGAGRGFVLDEHSLEDARKYGDQPGFDSRFYNRYVWHIIVDTFDGHHHYAGYLYDIDVTDGKMIYKDYMYYNLAY